MLHTLALPLPLRRQILLAFLATVLLLALALWSSYRYQAGGADMAGSPWIDQPVAGNPWVDGVPDDDAPAPEAFVVIAGT